MASVVAVSPAAKPEENGFHNWKTTGLGLDLSVVSFLREVASAPTMAASRYITLLPHKSTRINAWWDI